MRAECEYIDETLEVVKLSSLSFARQNEEFAAYRHDTPGIFQFAKMWPTGTDSSDNASQWIPTKDFVRAISIDYFSARAREQETLAVAALFSAKSKTGKFPDSLPGDFIDPFCEKLFVYKRTPHGFILSSSAKPENYKSFPQDILSSAIDRLKFEYPIPAKQVR